MPTLTLLLLAGCKPIRPSNHPTGREICGSPQCGVTSKRWTSIIDNREELLEITDSDIPRMIGAKMDEKYVSPGEADRSGCEDVKVQRLSPNTVEISWKKISSKGVELGAVADVKETIKGIQSFASEKGLKSQSGGAEKEIRAEDFDASIRAAYKKTNDRIISGTSELSYSVYRAKNWKDVKKRCKDSKARISQISVANLSKSKIIEEISDNLEAELRTRFGWPKNVAIEAAARVKSSITTGVTRSLGKKKIVLAVGWGA